MDGAYVSCMEVFHPAHAISLTATSIFTKKNAAKCDGRTIKHITATINNGQTAEEERELRLMVTSEKAKKLQKLQKGENLKVKVDIFPSIPPLCDNQKTCRDFRTMTF